MEDIENGLLTIPVDVESQEFKDFQLLIAAKSTAMSKKEKVSVELYGLRLTMQDCLRSSSNNTIDAGGYLKSALNLSGIRQNRFAEYIGLKPSNLSKIFTGERKISLDQALIFESIFGIKAKVWLGIQVKNELKKVSGSLRRKFGKYKINELIS